MVIFQHFEVFGPILSLTLDRCPTTMKSKRMCYISFTELINAAKAKSAMSGFKVENKILAIQAAGNDYLAEKQILDHAVKKIQIDSKLKNAVVKDPNNILYERKKQHLEGVTGSAVKHDRKHRNLIQSVQVEVGAGAAIAGIFFKIVSDVLVVWSSVGSCHNSHCLLGNFWVGIYWSEVGIYWSGVVHYWSGVGISLALCTRSGICFVIGSFYLC